LKVMETVSYLFAGAALTKANEAARPKMVEMYMIVM